MPPHEEMPAAPLQSPSAVGAGGATKASNMSKQQCPDAAARLARVLGMGIGDVVVTHIGGCETAPRPLSPRTQQLATGLSAAAADVFSAGTPATTEVASVAGFSATGSRRSRASSIRVAGWVPAAVGSGQLLSLGTENTGFAGGVQGKKLHPLLEDEPVCGEEWLQPLRLADFSEALQVATGRASVSSCEEWTLPGPSTVSTCSGTSRVRSSVEETSAALDASTTATVALAAALSAQGHGTSAEATGDTRAAAQKKEECQHRRREAQEAPQDRRASPISQDEQNTPQAPQAPKRRRRTGNLQMCRSLFGMSLGSIVWKERHVSVQGGFISIFRKEGDARVRQKIPLAEVQAVGPTRKDVGGRQHCFAVVTREAIHNFQTRNGEHLRQWMEFFTHTLAFEARAHKKRGSDQEYIDSLNPGEVGLNSASPSHPHEADEVVPVADFGQYPAYTRGRSLAPVPEPVDLNQHEDGGAPPGMVPVFNPLAGMC
eukprot:Hpha_TRINITY_DN15857_c4_g1::TRINITY_DN15857_c4_g1_i1::g.190642::m.190642